MQNVDYAFDTKEIFRDFKPSSEASTDKACAIFTKSVYHVLEDVIENDVSFQLPGLKYRKGIIRMVPVQGDELKRLRKQGRFENVDVVKSEFTAYRMILDMSFLRNQKTTSVMLSEKFEDRITYHTNNGRKYCDTERKTYKNYVDTVSQYYPETSRKEITRILEYGWKAVMRYKYYMGDVYVKGNQFQVLFGEYYRTPGRFRKYRERKLRCKALFYVKTEIDTFDGYYYLLFNDRQYKEFMNYMSDPELSKKKYTFRKVAFFRYREVCEVDWSGHLFRTILPRETKSVVVLEHFTPDILEHITDRRFKAPEKQHKG